MNVTRSIVYGVVGECKTESSQKPVPIHPLVADALLVWRKQSTYIKPDDWVFASRRHRGRHPVWGQAILRKYVRPVAEKVGIQKCIGWHTFRHTYSTLLRIVGTEFKVMQELLRHSTLRSTLDVYTQAITPAKHAAQAAVLSLSFPAKQMERHKRRDRMTLPREGKSTGRKGTQRGHENVPHWVLDGFPEISASTLERMAGTTRLELAPLP